MKPGFGFVDGDDGVSYYYHAAELKGQAITVGAHVSFTPKSNPKGPVAVGIKLLEAVCRPREEAARSSLVSDTPPP